MTCSTFFYRLTRVLGLATALVLPLAAPAVAQPHGRPPARYDHYGYHGHDGNAGAVVAGALLGLGAGALLGSAAAGPPPAYAAPPPAYYAPPPPAYYPPPPPAYAAPPPPVYYGYGP